MFDLLFDLQLFAADDNSVNGDVADPAEAENKGEPLDEDTGDVTGTDEGDAGVVDQQGRTSKQPPELDAAFAKLRREAEQYKRELEARDKWVAETFGKTHGITTWQQYQEAVQQTLQQQQAAMYRQKEQELASQGYDVNAIREIMKLDPEFQELRRQNELLQQQLQKQTVQQQFEAEFKELQAEYPEFKKVEDLTNKLSDEAYRKLLEKVNRGYSLLDAYESVNKAELRRKTAAAAKQKALNDLNSKSHLSTEGDGVGDSVDVYIPPETLQMYLDMGMNKKQAIAYHKKLYG